jgi:hypothetical protein
LNDDDIDDDDVSVQTTITVETTRTAHNENRKPVLTKNSNNTKNNNKKSTQVFVNQKDPLASLEAAQHDIATVSIYLKDITVTREVAKSFLSLIRGDNRSWEAIAVDILRQKARWENITLEDCSGDDGDNDSGNSGNSGNDGILDLMISFVLNLDNCAFLHLSSLVPTPHLAWSLQSLSFTKSLHKLQIDLIDLSFAIPMLIKGLETNTSLTCLITSRCGLGDDTLKDLLSHLPKGLEELRIFGNKCRGQGLAAITNLLTTTTSSSSTTTCQLQILDLSYQHVQEGDDFDISWLAASLTSNTTLKTLDLDNDSIDDGHLAHLCAALCHNKTLEELMLNHNNISGEGVGLFSSKFGQMKGLKKISMYSNLFDAPAAAKTNANANTVNATNANTANANGGGGNDG